MLCNSWLLPCLMILFLMFSLTKRPPTNRFFPPHISVSRRWHSLPTSSIFPFQFNQKGAYLNWLNLSAALFHPQKNVTFYSKTFPHFPSSQWHRALQYPHWLLNSPLASSRFSCFQFDCGLFLSKSLCIASFLLCFALPKDCLARQGKPSTFPYIFSYCICCYLLYCDLSWALLPFFAQYNSSLVKLSIYPGCWLKNQIINSFTLLFKKVRHSHYS